MSALYTIFIYPLELFFEVVFSIANRVVGNPGLAIIILSLAVNFLVLPLYNRADEVQKQERELEESLQSGIARIRKAFKGDERMMMLQAFYRENNYSPLYVLKGSVSLLLQIPFFMAAYSFLSNLALLNGASFGPISDLGSPDRMLPIGGITINLLPIVMTLINVISGYIYTRGMPLKSKVQLYGMALLFLVLLYNSPSGLAFYWTLNNVFSLCKNALYKLKKPGLVFSLFCAVTGVVMAVYVNTLYDTPYATRKVRLTLIALLLVLPLCFMIAKSKGIGNSLKIKIRGYSKQDRNIFILSGLFMAILTGFLIPSSVIKTSPSEFMDLMNLKNPIIYVWHAFFIATGFFVLWGGVFFALAREKTRAVMSRVWLILCPASLISYLFFGTDLGDISVNLVYVMPFEFTSSQKLINGILVVLAVVSILLIYRFIPRICEGLIITIVAVAAVMSFINIGPINDAYKENLKRVQSEFPQITLSTQGRNVMVIMLDRAPGFVVPYIFDEIPQLQEQYDGFTFYPNTVSFGSSTKFAAGALFGGYDYTPEAINSDTTRTLGQTQNEALSVMPVLFRDDGFEVTIIDPPYAGGVSPGDISVFSGPLYEGINAYNAKGVIVDDFYKFEEYQERIWLRNFFCYSVFKVSPLYIQATVYNEGRYNRPEEPVNYETDFTLPQIGFGPSISSGVNRDFMSAYETLNELDDITTIVNDSTDTFMYMDNDTAHDAILLHAPEYRPLQYVDNTEYDAAHTGRFDSTVNGYSLDMNSYTSMSHYASNAAAYIQLGFYFDYLRQSGAWDNTRIIIVSDHGIMNQYANMFGGQLDIGAMNIDAFNPVLMVKDFGASGFNIDESIMTNADVPYIATNGIIENPVNPFTGNPLVMNHEMPFCVLNSDDWTVAGPDALRFAEDDWYVFNGNEVYNTDSWEFDGVR